MNKTSKIVTLATVLGLAAGAYLENQRDSLADDIRCSNNEWRCSTNIPSTISSRSSQYANEESKRFAAIVGQETYANFNGCDETIAIAAEVNIAYARVVAEFANQFSGHDMGVAKVNWTPPTTEQLLESFKHVADNKLGFHCGAISPEYFADDNQDTYNAALLKYAQGTKFDYL